VDDKTYIDERIEEVLRRIDESEKHIDALFREKERALDMAAAERDRAAEVLREEQRRALEAAAEEREKSAAALRAATDRQVADNYARLKEQIDAADQAARDALDHVRELMDAHRAGDQLAIDKALEASKELAEKHNDLIHSAETKDESYATKVELKRLENWQSKVSGGLIAVAGIGVANFVKLWTG
jgi:ABC-type transporter Mla subunit MlaD